MVTTQPAEAHLMFRHWLAAVLLVLCAPLAGQAAQVVITLDGVPATACNETWTEAGVLLSLVATAPEDCDGGGNCSFGVGASSVDLFPARLNLDLSGLGGTVTSAEVDVQDFCGTGCTQAFLYQGATEVDSAANTGGGSQTLSLSAGGSGVDRLAVSSCEGQATEIRLEVGPPAAAVPSLSRSSLLALTLSLGMLGAVVALRLRAPGAAR